jgi:hypothetical protein
MRDAAWEIPAALTARGVEYDFAGLRRYIDFRARVVVEREPIERTVSMIASGDGPLVVMDQVDLA